MVWVNFCLLTFQALSHFQVTHCWACIIWQSTMTTTQKLHEPFYKSARTGAFTNTEVWNLQQRTFPRAKVYIQPNSVHYTRFHFHRTHSTRTSYIAFTHQKQHRQRFVTMRRKIYFLNLTNCTTNSILSSLQQMTVCVVCQKKETKVWTYPKNEFWQHKDKGRREEIAERGGMGKIPLGGENTQCRGCLCTSVPT